MFFGNYIVLVFKTIDLKETVGKQPYISKMETTNKMFIQVGFFINLRRDVNVKSFNPRYQRAKPVIIDPGLYSLHKSDVFWVSEKRSVPTAYKLFTGK